MCICFVWFLLLANVVIDYANNPKASTGDFECVYRQPMTLPKYGSAAELFVRGCSLPNDYFYKGHIEIQESYEDPEIGTEQDVEAILNKLKRFYDTDDTVMVQPYVSDEKIIKTKDEPYSHSSLTENDIPTIDLSNQSSKNLEKVDSEISCSRSKKSHVTDLKSVSCNTNILKQSFSFSALDDGSQGKASCIEFTKEETENFKMHPIIETVALENRNQELCSISKQNDSVFIAASKLISFMKDKEKEYLR